MINEGSNVVQLRFQTFTEARENERAILEDFGEEWRKAFQAYDDAMQKIAVDSDALAKLAPSTVASLFIRVSKVDVAKRIVYGTAAIEQSSKPELEKWSGGIANATVRSMDSKIAAGKLVKISFDDKRGTIDIAAEIIDAGEWRKVTEGVYTGFTTSAAGMSLVDMPLASDAAFAVIKNDGGEELRKFAPQPQWRRDLHSLWSDVAVLEESTNQLKKSNANMRSILDVEVAKQAAILSLKARLDAAVKSRDERLYGATAVAKRSLRFARANPVAFYGKTS